MQSFEMPSFVCGINNGFFFFFWRGGKTLEGEQECSLEQCCNQFETTWDSCDEECKSELLFMPFNFPFKIRCLWKLALILMVKFLCSLRCRCLKSRMSHIQRHSLPRKLFYSCFSFPVLSCGSMKRDNRKPQSLDAYHCLRRSARMMKKCKNESECSERVSWAYYNWFFCRWTRTRTTFSPKKTSN